MKKKIISSVLILVGLIAAYVLGSGFRKEGSAYIGEYTVSSDGTEMMVVIGVGSSVGYVREVAVHQQQGKLYLDCYSAFGGINGSIGAKSQYTISLDDDTDTIALYRNTNCYDVILEKDSNGEWQRAPLNQNNIGQEERAG